MPYRLELDSLWMALQPIVDLESGRVVGHEVLVRGAPDSPWPQPEALAAQARREGREQQLELRCRALALRAGRDLLPADQRLFVNVDMRYAVLPIDNVAPPMEPRRVAIEISERQPILDNPRALDAIHRWRRHGYAIVLDDYGTGYASLGTLLAIQPDIIKVDRRIVADVDSNPRHHRALVSLLELARDLGTEVIAEGIETKEEMRSLRAMGVVLGQGFLLGRPAPQPGGACPAGLMRETTPPTGVRDIPARDPASAEAFHQALLGAIGQGVYYVDRRRTILHWNAAAEAITGFGAADVVGRNCMVSRLGHLSATGVPLCYGACPLVHTMADGLPREETLWIRHKGGHRIAASVRTTPVLDSERRIIGAVEVFTPAATLDAEGRPPDRAVAGCGNVRRDGEVEGPTLRAAAR